MRKASIQEKMTVVNAKNDSSQLQKCLYLIKKTAFMREKPHNLLMKMNESNFMND